MTDKANETEAIPKCARVECQTLQEELEKERIRLAACGVAALQNTKESTKDRIDSANPYFSSSYSDVCRAVDREITLRAQLDDAKDLLRDAGFLLIPNAPKHSHRICIFLAKLEELEK